MTGWTWEYIDDHMDIPRLMAMNRHWRDSPPIHIMLARFFGYDAPKQKTPARDDPDAEMAELLGMMIHVQ